MKKIAILALSLLLVVAVVGSASAKVVIKLASSGPALEDNRTVKAVKVFADLVEKGTNGEVVIQAYHASSLGSEREALEGIKMGTIEMGTLTSGPVPGFFPPVMIFDIPYLFSSAPAAWEAFNGEFGTEFSSAFLKNTGVRILGITENGYRHFTNNKRPINVPSDMEGLKIRTMENPAHMKMTKALGADPTPIAFGELYMALQQNVVDGMECPTVLINDMKFYEVQKYMVLDGHLYNPIFIFINEQFFQDKLTPAQQKVVADAAKVLAVVHNGFSQQSNIEGLENLKAMGMEVVTPTEKSLKQFREISQPVALDYIKEKAGDVWVEKALKAAKLSEEVVGSRSEQIVKDHIKLANDKYQQIGK
jgi:C4-dicarboxylate-binding protein DctP